MKRNVLLVEPNYKNKFPPIGLMKLATYFKMRGDNVVFYKGEIKNFILDRTVDKCIDKLYQVTPNVDWKSKHSVIKAYIKTRKSQYIESLGLDNSVGHNALALDWLFHYKDYIWKKHYLKDEEKDWDWIGVTTLFTFYFDITAKTINEVKTLLKPNGRIMVGGILATLQPKELEEATGIKPFAGLLSSRGIIDSDSSEIIDTLPLDYSILEEIDYKYPMANAYYGSMSKGCVRQCAFCAVPKLEPVYQDFMPMSDRIERVKEHYGEQRNLLLMDNNVLASKEFERIIEDIKKSGFAKGDTYQEPNQLELAINNLKKDFNHRAYLRKAQREYVKFLDSIKDKELSYKVYSILYDKGLLSLGTSTVKNAIAAYSEIEDDYVRHYNKKRPKQRIVDFNQGVDARLFTERKAELLSQIAISPLRIAFDSLAIKKQYLQAMKWSAQFGIKNFSNYLLYNFKDKPDDLYERLEINVQKCRELNVNIYSFPMKYHPLFGEHSHRRDYIGEHWNRKYIRSIQAVLNSTKGCIGRGESFFYKAFGKDKDAYHLLLDMPDTHIIYRYFFEWLTDKGHELSTGSWEQTYKSLSNDVREEFFSIIHAPDFTSVLSSHSYSGELKHIMDFYRNMREAVQDPSGELYKFKQEFDVISSVHARRAKIYQKKKH